MTVKFIPKDEPENRVRLSSLSAGAAFWFDNAIHIMSDEADCDLADEPYICLRPVSGYLVRLSGDELVRLTTLELREV
jgi:hypothetical protein